jgi:hypothetical protein
MKYCQAACALRRGSEAARLKYSPQAGCISSEGLNRSAAESASFSMKAAHSSRGVMPLASPAAMKLPAETPT